MGRWRIWMAVAGMRLLMIKEEYVVGISARSWGARRHDGVNIGRLRAYRRSRYTTYGGFKASISSCEWP